MDTATTILKGLEELVKAQIQQAVEQDRITYESNRLKELLNLFKLYQKTVNTALGENSATIQIDFNGFVIEINDSSKLIYSIWTPSDCKPIAIVIHPETGELGYLDCEIDTPVKGKKESTVMLGETSLPIYSRDNFYQQVTGDLEGLPLSEQIITLEAMWYTLNPHVGYIKDWYSNDTVKIDSPANNNGI